MGYENTTCQNEIKFTSDNYLEMDKSDNYLQAYLTKLQRSWKCLGMICLLKILASFGHNEITSHFSLTFYDVSSLDMNRSMIIE